ncbi:MAG: flagellar hook-basal body complex protein FliE [Pirellulales bacterium]
MSAIQSIGGVPGSSGQITTNRSAPTKTGSVPFVQTISELLGEANANQVSADQSINDLVTGRTDNAHDVVLSLAKADLSFRMVLEIRNRLIEAYQEVLRMQI